MMITLISIKRTASQKPLLLLIGVLFLGILAVIVQDVKLLFTSSVAKISDQHDYSSHSSRSLKVEGNKQEQQKNKKQADDKRRTKQDKDDEQPPIPPYSQIDIEKAMPYFHSWYMRLLVFDGKTWNTYAIGHNSTKLGSEFLSTPRLFQLVPMLVHALVHNFPHRFLPGKPLFQLVFTEADLVSSDCVFRPHEVQCPSHTFPPMLAFGSVLKDESKLPTLKLFPATAGWFNCLYLWRTHNQRCLLNQRVNFAKLFHQLKPQVIWRGADWEFLPHIAEYQSPRFLELRWKTELYWSKTMNRTSMLDILRNYTYDLPPRWRTILWTLEEDEKKFKNNIQNHPKAKSSKRSIPSTTNDLPWIDSRFYGGVNQQFRKELMNLGLQVDGERMDEFEMSGYKYQIDTGGGGGTTWDGTLLKLLSPGLLLHHETPTKDFFYDEMIPWKHYLPIHRDLSNLRDMYEWAEANPEGAKLIAHEATRFAEYIISPRYMSKIYRELFVNYLGKVVRAYRPLSGKNTMEQWQQLEKHYKDTGHTIIPLSSCDDSHCTTDGGGGIIKKLLYRQAQ